MASTTPAGAGPDNSRRRAVCTLLTSDTYLAGALVAINSLLDVEHSARKTTLARDFETVCLVTPATVGQQSIKALQKTFDCVVGVAEIETESWTELDLLGRRDLAASLTKLHLFRLTQYDTVIFLDADTLVCRPLTPLFDTVNPERPFAAAPDSGWPDAFNSGVMVVKPSLETFNDLVKMMNERGSWDGGDQGLLNDYFPNWHRLSFTYNVTPSAYYTYAPAYRRHGGDAAVLHFIGRDKPWKRGTRAEYDPDAAVKDYYGLVNQWYDVYERHYGVSLTYDVASRVIQPPASFKSTYTDMPAHEGAKPRTTPKSSMSATTPAPIAMSSGRDSPPKLTWDPATSSPPRDSSAFQMREPITERYDNMWDDPSKKKQKQRWTAPTAYPAVPKSTHDWYKDVMRQQPDPSAVKAVFPWEKSYGEQDNERSGSTDDGKGRPAPAREFPPSKPGTPPDELAARKTFAQSSTFTNAWDAIPGINRYAKQLARSAKRQSATSAGSGGDASAPLEANAASQKEAKRNELAGRQSSLKELKMGHGHGASGSGGGGSSGGVGNGGRTTYGDRRSDASSRDGDDEDDDETPTSGSSEENDERHGDDEDIDERDRPRIIFKRQPSASGSAAMGRSRSGSAGSASGGQQSQSDAHGRRSASGSSSGSGSGNGDASSSSQHQSFYSAAMGDTPPRSPTKLRSGSKESRHGGPGSPRSNRVGSYFPNPSPSDASGQNGSSSANAPLPSSSSHHRRDIRLNTSAPQPTSTPGGGAVSPRLAIRNSAAARMTSSGAGTGDGPPLVRATRVFSPDTDTGVVKQQGLAALQRFVDNFEAANGAGGAGVGGQQQQQQQ